MGADAVPALPAAPPADELFADEVFTDEVLVVPAVPPLLPFTLDSRMGSWLHAPKAIAQANALQQNTRHERAGADTKK